MTLAAKSLYLTSSAISHSLRRLESELGTSLLNRNPRNLAMTPAGQKLYNLSRPVLSELKKIRLEINHFEELTSNVIRVGTNSALNLYGFPKTLVTLRKHYPHIIVQVVCHTQSILQRLFDSKELDLLLLPELEEQQGSDTIKKMLGYDQMDLFFNEDILYDKKENITNNLKNQTVIAEQGLKTNFSKNIKNKLSYPWDGVKNYLFLDGEESVKRYVQNGLGMGMLPHWMVSKEISRGQLRSFSQGVQTIKRYWYYQFLNEKNVSPLVKILKMEMTKSLGFQAG